LAKHAVVACLIALAAFLTSPPANAEKAATLSQVSKVYIESFGASKRAQDIRGHLIRRIERSAQIQVVSDPSRADAIIKGTGQVWTVGEISLSPHSHSANEPVLEGYLSVEVVGKGGQTLWSYLSTPSKFAWSSIEDDLARQIATRLLDDMRSGRHTREAAAPENASRSAASLRGAGATFPAPLYQKWFESFEELHPEVHITYEGIGSGEGIRRVEAGEVDFGASEMPLSEKSLAGMHSRVIQVPVVLGAVVPIFNLPQLRHKIRFTGEILAGIYLGKIRKWNDGRIRAANPDASLPDAEIAVVYRSDSSGTSYVWSDYLSKISPDWKSSVGEGVDVRWPVGTGAAYNEGVAAAVQKAPNTIGYVELIYAIQHELSYAAVKNAAGEYVKASLASVTEAARDAGTDASGFRLSITDAPGKSDYPIATYTWLLLPGKFDDKSKQATLLDLLRWMLTSGQKSCSALGYAPLPPDLARNAQQSAEKAFSEP
jgi:phosphate transport system substrate-binding protein